MSKQNSTQLHPLSASLHRIGYFLEHNFLLLMFAIGFPTIISLTIFWTGFGITLAQLGSVTNFQELAGLFSWGSSTTYMLFLMGLLLFCLNVIGLITGPLVMVEHDRIQWKQILPKSLLYFFPYVRLGLLVTLALVVVYVISFLIIVIITSIVGFINFNDLDIVFNYLTAILPNVGVVILALLFMFSPFILIEYNRGAYHALAMSVALVRQNFWPLVLRLTLVISCLLLFDFLLLFIPYVGYGLSIFVSTLVMTIYNFVLYEDVTGVTWR